jgi:hypothetical protein
VQAAVAGGAGLRQIVVIHVVPGRVAVAVIRTGGGVVAHDPVFVKTGLAGSEYLDRRTPVDPIRRTADQDVVAGRATDSERAGQPDAVFRVVGDTGIADPRIGAGRVLVGGGQGRQQTVLPGPVGIRSPAGRVGAAITEPTDLKDRNFRVAEGERVRLDLSLMVSASRCGERVRADLGERGAGQSTPWWAHSASTAVSDSTARARLDARSLALMGLFTL